MISKTVELPEFPSTSSGRSTDEDLIKRLRSTHDLHDRFAPQWNFFLSAYESGPEFACKSNLFQHQRETDEDYAERVKRAHNLNYCELIVGFFTNFIFSEPIDRNGNTNSDFYTSFVSDVNMKGETIDDFMKEVCDDMQVFGMSYVLVDAPRRPEGIVVTKQDELDSNFRPYWVLIKPEEVIDWSTDKFGNFVYVKRRQLTDDRVAGERRLIEEYTEWTKELITLTRVDVTKESEPFLVGPPELLDNELGVVPIEVVRYKRSKKFPHMGLSFLRDLAGNNRKIMNLSSMLDEFLYRQAFNILSRQVDNLHGAPGMSEDSGDISAANVMEYPKDTERPAYISPPVDPAAFIQSERSKITNEMFKIAAQDFVGEIFNGEKSSGFAQAQSFSKTVPYISSRAESLERAENRLMALTLKMMGREWDGKVKYKDRYELTNLTDALTQFMTLVKDLNVPSETFIREELKRLVREFDGKLPKDILAKIESEIEKFEFEKWKDETRQKSQTSPGAQQKEKSTGTMAELAAESNNQPSATNKLRQD
jgi:hypothetical protein